MSLDKNRIFRIVIISILFMTIMLAGKWYYGRNMLEVTKIVLQQKEYISNVDIERDGDDTIIHVTLRDVDNLKEVYSQILDTIERQFKEKSFTLKIVNNPGKTIESLYNDQIQFIIYEAIQTGEYTQMKTRLDKINIDNVTDEIKVFIDNKNLYLQIKNDKYSLYDVIKRDS
ncbi:MAG: hypothetical protein ACOX2A_12460 [Tepidanaerobacteraceae bacterium]|nr:hypothetical protein [Thermoanaerobacterales bacterium]